MLLQVLFLVLFLATLSAALLTNGVYAMRAAQHDLAARTARLIAEQQTAAYVRQARSIVARQGSRALASGDVWMSSGDACGGSSANCPFTFVAQVRPRSGTASAAGSNAPNDAALNMQESYVDEQRTAVSLEVALLDRRQMLVARRMRFLTLRTFNAAPWVTIVGNREPTAHLTDAAGAQGDTGGISAQAGDAPAPDPNAPDAYRDTRIHVVVQCLNDGIGGGTAGNEGLAWGANPNGGVQVRCPPQLPASSGDAFSATPRPWFNGDANASSWSR